MPRGSGRVNAGGAGPHRRNGGGNGQDESPPALGLQFPCRFEIKAMGRHSVRFEALVQAIVTKHISPEDLLGTQRRFSRNQRYLSVTCIIRASSRAQLDSIYADLRQCPDVLAAL